jgi:adenylate cyclase
VGSASTDGQALMALEIERRFLVADTSCLDGLDGDHVIQAYLARGSATVRIRITGKSAWLTIKGPGRLARSEWEYSIPPADAREILELALPGKIEKTRYLLRHEGTCWVVDRFHGRHDGLIIAEVELDDPHQPISLPPWLGPEITHEAGWSNAELSASVRSDNLDENEQG